MTSPLAPYRRALAEAATEAVGIAPDLRPEVVAALERQIRVPDKEHGDLALPCFELAKRTKQSPQDAARQVQAALGANQTQENFSRVEAAGPYVNATIGPAALAKAVVSAARSTTYGGSAAGEGKTVVIDFSSPNIAKPLAFHHIRSTVIGAAIGRIHAAQGWKVVGINYLGDWGKQFGLLATGFARYGDPAKRANAKHLIEVYVQANKDANVGGAKARIAAPAKAREMLAIVEKARAAAQAAADGKPKKKAEKSLKSATKKLAALRGADAPADPTDGVDSWLSALDADRARAQSELPALEARNQEARMFFKRLEDGEAEAVAEWQEFRTTSIAEFERVYKRMGVEFTAFEGESFYTDVLESVVERVTDKPGTKESDGALIVDMDPPKGEPPVLLKTRDGTTLYITRDLAAAIDRYERFEFDRSLYVVAKDQSLHFSQLFRTLGGMGFDWADRMTHVQFGRVHGMSTRKGKVVFLDTVLDLAVEKAREVCEASEKIDKARLEETIEAVGIGSVVFRDLKNPRLTDYEFDADEIVSFEGHTGPYAQFSHARTSSILRRAGGAPAQANLSRLTLPEERNVLMALAQYPEVVAAACDQFEPSLVTRMLLDLAQTTASYLTAGNKDRGMRILVEGDDELRDARLALVDAIRNVLAAGLRLLGVAAPEAM